MSQFAGILARTIFGHESVARRLEKSAFVQAVAQKLRAREWINAALARHPIRRNLSDSGVKYDIETFEALSVERMYFGNPIYREIFERNFPKTFIDLGCNSGLFPCFLSHLARARPLSGLCIDANSAQIDLARKCAELNGWKNIHFRHGLVGSQNAQAEESEFFLHPTSLGSSQFAYQDSESGRSNEWKRISVPALEVAALWGKLFGSNVRCNCLKIDIEGSEMIFLHSEALFLALVDSILIEWHSWTTSQNEVAQFLARYGFIVAMQIENAPRYGVLFFLRKTE